MVRATGLEPARLATQDPKSCVYANFTTPARRRRLRIVRFHASAKVHSLRCSSFSKQNFVLFGLVLRTSLFICTNWYALRAFLQKKRYAKALLKRIIYIP